MFRSINEVAAATSSNLSAAEELQPLVETMDAIRDEMIDGKNKHPTQAVTKDMINRILTSYGRKQVSTEHSQKETDSYITIAFDELKKLDGMPQALYDKFVSFGWIYQAQFFIEDVCDRKKCPLEKRKK